MRHITAIVLFILPLLCAGQNNNCQCESGNKPDTVFHFSNGKNIALCGYRDTLKGKVVYSDFSLKVCGADTVISSWDGTETCNVYRKKNVVTVEVLEQLPIGANFADQSIIWLREKIYFEKEKIQHTITLNRNIRKYNAKEIASILKEYEKADPDSYSSHAPTSDTGIDSTEFLMFKLFCATISGSKNARQCFFDFANKFKPDAGFAEEYGDLNDMLGLWDEK